MVFITESLVKKRAEHNNLEITTLEELSLHQLDIERIEYLDKWCRDLKILYLQCNLIPRIENVKRLKKLEYLNLALNNIKKIENLEGCESLNKLDLTVNFVAELTSVESLKANTQLRELFLTGNPCTEYEGYRDYVIATLPNLAYFDGQEVDKSSRILALQQYTETRNAIIRQQKQYFEREATRVRQSQEGTYSKSDSRWYTDIDNEENKTNGNSKANKSYWDQPSQYTPESRVEVYKHMEEEKRKREEENSSKKIDGVVPQREVRLFNDQGKPFNVNQAKIDFKLTESEDNGNYELEIACYKHLDTSQIEVDVQPFYIRVTIKGKILQLVFTEEVHPDDSVAKRSQTTGHLHVNIPKLKKVVCKRTISTRSNCPKAGKEQPSDRSSLKTLDAKNTGVTLSDVINIVQETKPKTPHEKVLISGASCMEESLKSSQVVNNEDFVDDPHVPPLI